MNFKIGQRVLCVNDYKMRYCLYPIRKGLVYTIAGFYKCSCGSDQVTLSEVPCMTNMVCKCEKISYRRQSYYAWRFIPMGYFEKFTDLSKEKQGKKKEYISINEEVHEDVTRESSLVKDF